MTTTVILYVAREDKFHHSGEESKHTTISVRKQCLKHHKLCGFSCIRWRLCQPPFRSGEHSLVLTLFTWTTWWGDRRGHSSQCRAARQSFLRPIRPRRYWMQKELTSTVNRQGTLAGMQCMFWTFIHKRAYYPGPRGVTRGVKGVTIPQAPNYCRGHKKSQQSHVLSSIQNICFGMTPGSNMGAATLLLTQGAI